MSRDTRIGCMADFDLNQYQFQRSSGLPRGYFDRRSLVNGALWTLTILLALLCAAVIVLTH